MFSNAEVVFVTQCQSAAIELYTYVNNEDSL